MQLQVQAVHRVVCLVDQAEEFAVLVEALRLESPLASEQETVHWLNQITERGRLLEKVSTVDNPRREVRCMCHSGPPAADVIDRQAGLIECGRSTQRRDDSPEASEIGEEVAP
jgi:hypothetical protein